MGYHTKIKVQHEPLEEIKKSLHQSSIELEDSFLDSLLNFDGWVEDHSNSSLAEVMNSEEKANLEQKEQLCGSEKLGDLGSLIQEGIDRVCLTSVLDHPGSTAVDEKIVRHHVDNLEVVGDGKENEVRNNTEVSGDIDSESSEEDESESSSSSSSSSDSDESDEDDLKKVKGEVEMEEGEIREEVVVWSDVDEDEDEDGNTVKGPIRSVNEVKNLPPVPPVTVTIQPHHQTLPVGVVLSIMGCQVIVEGVEDHNPLSEGSILWITENRSPLGVVDEIFGPVKNPYYSVRYNSETEIPTGIQQGSLISFVPEFADYVLNNNNLYKKGYDASGAYDEECSEDLEFSDDEKEAEYKRMMKMAKRGSGGEKNGHMKKDKKSRNRGGTWNQPSTNSQVNASSSGPTSEPTSRPQVFSQASNTTPSGIWPYGFPPIQPQNIGFPPNGFPSPFMQQNFTRPPFQNLGVPPQFSTPGQMFPCNLVQAVPPNFAAFASWPSGMPQNNFNQSQTGLPMMYPQGGNNLNQMQAGLPMVFPQGDTMPNRPEMENNKGAVRPFADGETNQNPNQGSGGRKPFQRGGHGRFRRGPRSR